MATDVRSSRSAMRGLFICDDRLVFWESLSTLTQAGPRPGLAVTSLLPSNLTLEFTGSCAEEREYGITVRKAGLPSRTDEGCRVELAVGGLGNMGWNTPTASAGWDVLHWSANSFNDVVALDAVSLPDGKVLMMTAREDGDTIERWVRDVDGTWRSPTTEATTEGAYGQGVALLVLPTGRVLCFFWDGRSGPGDIAQIVCEYSDDEGRNTWLTASRGVLNSPPTLNTAGAGRLHYDQLGQLRACYHNGQILLLASMRVADDDVSPGCRNVVIQYASRDGGASFSKIYEGDPQTVSVLLGSQFDCDVTDGRIVVTWASVTGAAPPYSAILTSPFESLADAETQVVSADFGCADVGSAATSGGQITSADCTMCVADDGIVYVYFTAYSDDQEAIACRSVDGGATWETLGRSSTLSDDAGPWWNAHSATNYPTRTCAVAHQGQVLLFHGFESDSASARAGSVAVAYLGGWCTFTFPFFGNVITMKDRSGWDLTWFATVRPDLAGWTAVGTGTVLIDGDGLRIQTTAATKSYSQVISGTIEQGMNARAALSVATGGTGSAQVRVGCILADGSSDYELECRVGTTQVAIYDAISNTLEGTVVADCTAGVEIVCSSEYDATNGIRFYVWVRGKNRLSPSDWDRVNFTATDGGATARTTNRFYWGHGAISTADSTWTEAHCTGGDYTAGTLQTFDSDLSGRPLPAVPVFLDDGLYIRGRGGPGFTAEEWAVEPSYDYPVGHIDPIEFPSPRNSWRSQNDTDDVYLTYNWGTMASYESGMRSPLLGLLVLGANWDSGEIQGMNSAGAWSTIYEIDASEGLGPIHFSCQWGTVRPNSSSGTNPFFKTNELAGCTLSMGGGIFRKIRSNSGGRWSTGGGQQAVIILDDADGSEPATGTTGAIHPKDFMVVVAQSATQGYRALRLWIEGGQGTADGFFEIGTLAWGHVEVFGDEYSWDRTVETQPSIDRSVASDGTDRVRVLAPPVRIARVAWPNPVNTTPLYSSDEPEPDFLTGSSLPGAAAVASIGATAYQVEALVSLTDSGRIPVAYVPKLPFGGATSNLQVQLLNRRDQFIWGRFLGGATLETSMGEELDNEMVRASQIEIEELP